MSENKKRSGNTAVAKTKTRRFGQVGDIFRRLRKNKAAMFGLIVVIILILMALLSGVLVDYESVVSQNITERLQPPSLMHLFGTDELGRDILSRIVYGSRISLAISCASVGIALVVGCLLGAIAGYFGGLVDNIIMRCMDILLSIPGMLLALCIIAALGNSTGNLIIAVTISTIPQLARIMRSSTITIRDQEYIQAARAIGAKNTNIIISHIFPNCFGPVIVQAAINIGTSILTVAGLSFIGLGVSSPTPEWGAMLSDARAFIRDSSYMTIFPGVAIMLTVLSFNLLSDGLRDAMDPRLR